MAFGFCGGGGSGRSWLLVCLVSACVLSGCLEFDPAAQTFACVDNTDCVDGYECVKHEKYPVKVCALECEVGFVDCRGDIPGCETRLGTVDDCGHCGEVCGDQEMCVVETGTRPYCEDPCRDPATPTLCQIGEEALCVDTIASTQHCGGCGVTCSANQICNDGNCECQEDFADCTDEPGCESSLLSVGTCGSCDNACAGVNLACVDRQCSCAEGYADCSDAQVGCEASLNDVATCGGCLTACETTEVCDEQACTCPTEEGWLRCGDLCVDTLVDVEFCGGCNTSCDADQSCASGACSCKEGMGDCDESVEGCETSLIDNVDHCGGCGVSCWTPNVLGAMCNGVECSGVCLEGFGDCDQDLSSGCETDFNSSREHCGGCDSPCAEDEDCGVNGCVSKTVEIEAGGDRTCALRADGTAYCWGFGLGAQGLGFWESVGAGPIVGIPDPITTMSLGGTRGTDVRKSYGHACATTTVGEVYCWGHGDVGQIGAGCTPGTFPGTLLDFCNSNAAVLVEGIVSSNIDVSAGYIALPVGDSGVLGTWVPGHSCAIEDTPSQTMKCWGGNLNGELGNGEDEGGGAFEYTVPNYLPTSVLEVSGSVLDGMVALSLGAGFSCGIRSVGGDSSRMVYCWGRHGTAEIAQLGFLGEENHYNAVGLDNMVLRADLGNLPLIGVSDLSSGIIHACAIEHGDSIDVYCWGKGGTLVGQDGVVEATLAVRIHLPPEEVPSDVEVSPIHSCVLMASGKVFCWGANEGGVLGDGTEVLAAQPVEALGITDAVDIAVGYRHSCALRSTGQVVCWGDNTYGQLDGDGVTHGEFQTSPVLVPNYP